MVFITDLKKVSINMHSQLPVHDFVLDKIPPDFLTEVVYKMWC